MVLKTDLDLGHYERFIDENLTKESNITSGRIYKNVIEKERRGEYEGRTVQVVPHFTNEIKKKVYHAASTSKADIIITEIWGTVRDIESLPFIKAIRQVRMEQGRENVIYMHVSLVPYIKNAKGILVPGGFEGKILACQFACENKIPFFEICFGMQAAVIDFTRNVCHIQDANSSELTETKNAIIYIIRGKDKTDALGETLRLGNYKTTLVPNTLVHKLYGKDEILERHRHRYEVNNDFREQLAQAGLVFSGLYAEKNLVEVIEIPNHPFYLATQYHPEFTSQPNKPNPLFNGFVQAVINNK